MNTKILFVDDEQNVLDSFKRKLRNLFEMDTANSGQNGLDLLSNNGPYSVVVSDMQMPQMDGVQFLSKVQEVSPDTIRLMLTGNADQETAIKAVNEGRVYQFLTKPCSAEQLIQALQNGIQQYQLAKSEKELLEKTLNGSIRILTEILSLADPEGFKQSQQLKEAIKNFSPILEGSDAWELELAAMLSSIGYVTLPPATMQKVRTKSALTGVEKDMIAQVPETGSNLIASIPRLENVARIILYQNKNYDGSGYPTDSVSGTEIPEGSRKLKIISDLIRLEGNDVPRQLIFDKMKTLQGVYDQEILDRIIASCKDSIESSAKEDLPIEFASLKIGNILASDLESTDGLRLMPASSQISQLALMKLKNLTNILTIKEPIYIKDSD